MATTFVFIVAFSDCYYSYLQRRFQPVLSSTDANKENVDEKGKAPLLTADVEDTDEADNAEDEDGEDDANEGDGGDMQARRLISLAALRVSHPRRTVIMADAASSHFRCSPEQQCLIDLKRCLACSWRGRCLRLPAPSTAKWETRRRRHLQVLPHQLPVQDIRWLLQGPAR